MADKHIDLHQVYCSGRRDYDHTDASISELAHMIAGHEEEIEYYRQLGDTVSMSYFQGSSDRMSELLMKKAKIIITDDKQALEKDGTWLINMLDEGEL